MIDDAAKERLQLNFSRYRSGKNGRAALEAWEENVRGGYSLINSKPNSIHARCIGAHQASYHFLWHA